MKPSWGPSGVPVIRGPKRKLPPQVSKEERGVEEDTI